MSESRGDGDTDAPKVDTEYGERSASGGGTILVPTARVVLRT